MEKEKLKKLFRLTATNFKFKLDGDFEIFFEMVYAKVQNISDELITKRFQQLWLTTTEEWNKEYGYAGYPSFADWIWILTERRALTDKQIEEEKARHEKSLRYLVGDIRYWVEVGHIDDRGRVFANYYNEPNHHKVKNLINKYYNINSELSYDELLELAMRIRKEKDDGWEDMRERLLIVARDENKLLLD